MRAGRRLDAWLADWLGELPVASHLFAAQMLYLMLRAAQLLFLP